jgi:ribosome biogenesis GTPase / thiamine phosphate phosphatase
MCTSDNDSDADGVVYKKCNGFYTVRPVDAPERAITCEISSRLRKELVYSNASPNAARQRVRQVRELEHSDPLAVGDRVRFRSIGEAAGLIVAVLPRRNRLARRAAVARPGAHAFEQVVVANVDQVVPVFAAAQPSPHWNLLDRYLASAESSGLPALICITKLDLVGGMDRDIQSIAAEYSRIGYPVVTVSAYTGAGLDELRERLRGRVSVLVGKSGVGKTSLLNALQPGLGLRVEAVNRVTGKGKHTTTALEMFALDFGGVTPLEYRGATPLGYSGAILDTPGVREYGLWEVAPEELASLFPEMRDLVGSCRFGLGCRHTEEPGCAIRQAVLAGRISPRRYHSYLRLLEDGPQS